jgi:hypothetical protein
MGAQARAFPMSEDRRWQRALVRSGQTLGVSILSLGVMCGLWQGIITVLHLSPFVAKGPVDVYDYLFTTSDAAGNRSELLSALGITVRDAALGYVAGTLAAVGVSVAIALRRGIGQTVMRPRPSTSSRPMGPTTSPFCAKPVSRTRCLPFLPRPVSPLLARCSVQFWPSGCRPARDSGTSWSRRRRPRTIRCCGRVWW